MEKEENPVPALRFAVEVENDDDAAMDAKLALMELEYPLRNLAANLLGVMRGAGKACDIGRDCMAVIEAFQAYCDEFGHPPASQNLERILSIQDEQLETCPDEEWERRLAMDSIVRGSLRIAAARLASQPLQVSAGEGDLREGVRALHRMRESMAAPYQDMDRDWQPERGRPLRRRS